MIFIDSCVLIGYIFKRDRFHNRSKQLINHEFKNEQKMINNTVITEVIDTIEPYDDIKVSEVVDKILAIDNIVYMECEDYIEAGNIFEYYGRKINYPDCTMVETMIKYRINTIATYDSHFDRIKGFRVIK